MTGVPERRDRVRFLQQKGIFKRQGCALLQISRSLYRYRIHPKPDGDMRSSLRQISQRNPVYDYRRAWALIRRDAQTINRKRVHRLWKQEQLCLAARKLRKRVRKDHPLPLCAAYPSHLWTYDFLVDRTQDGHLLKIWTVVDKFTKEALAIRVGRCLKASTVVKTLAGLSAHRETPQYLRSDNGPEFLASIVQSFLVQENVQTWTIALGCPWQNP